MCVTNIFKVASTNRHETERFNNLAKLGNYFARIFSRIILKIVAIAIDYFESFIEHPSNP